ncbi:hypothetical protein [Methylorubrum populi]|uniref:Uncharacterized protein n=1 Tax=Methylorubrum populi TaxID=223967 RepID=A0A833IZV7_9HYPH|nr:hypothetical protein [Methylorubrum populi]KAB7781968.1 hypothetical protein F8B43_5577 [Methylorubrum populi]
MPRSQIRTSVIASAVCLFGLFLPGEASAIEPVFDPYATQQPPSSPSIFLFSDTTIAYRYMANTKQPGNAGGAGPFIDGRSAPKHVITFAHVDAWQYGTNFLSIDFLRSGSQDPSGHKYPFNTIPTGDGALEYFGIYRGTLGFNAMSGTSNFAIPGFVKEISLAYGINNGKDNRSFRNDQLDLLAGFNFAFDVPVGFVGLSVHAYKSYNHNALVPVNRETTYNWAPELELTYGIPLPIESLPLSINGYVTMIWPRGRDSFGNPTRLQLLSRTDLVLDIGKLFYNQPNRLNAFIGFEYYQNKFGADQRFIPGANQKSFLAGIAIHLN